MDLPSKLPNALNAIACPECEKLFRLSEETLEQSSILCPHCQQELNVETLLEAHGDLNIPIATAKSDIDTGKKDEDAIPAGQATRSHGIDQQGYFIPKPLKTAQRSHSSSGKRRKSKSTKRKGFEENKNKGTVGEWIRVIAGGVIALPIAQLILWWMFAVDPLSLAPKVDKIVPIVVPPILKPEVVIEDDEYIEKDMPPSQFLRDQHVVPATINPDKN